MSNANRVKVKLYLRREDSKTYVEIPVNGGKEARPKFIIRRILEIFLVKDWVNIWDLMSFASSHDKNKMLKDIENVEKIVEMKEIKDGVPE